MHDFIYQANPARVIFGAGALRHLLQEIERLGARRTGRDIRVLPRTVIYDPELTLTLPLAMTVTSAFNAIAHAAEGPYAQDINPVLALMAEEGIRACAARAAASTSAWTAPPTWPRRRPTPTPGRWTAPRCVRCCSAPGMARHPWPDPIATPSS